MDRATKYHVWRDYENDRPEQIDYSNVNVSLCLEYAARAIARGENITGITSDSGNGHSLVAVTNTEKSKAAFRFLFGCLLDRDEHESHRNLL